MNGLTRAMSGGLTQELLDDCVLTGESYAAQRFREDFDFPPYQPDPAITPPPGKAKPRHIGLVAALILAPLLTCLLLLIGSLVVAYRRQAQNREAEYGDCPGRDVLPFPLAPIGPAAA